MIPRMATALWEPNLLAMNDNAEYLPLRSAYRRQALLPQNLHNPVGVALAARASIHSQHLHCEAYRSPG